MQQKYLKYFLLLGVTVIWGIIILQILNNLGDDTLVQQPAYQKSFFKIKDSSDYQPYELLLDYNDPFGAEEDKLALGDNTTNSKTGDVSYTAGSDVRSLKHDISFIRYKGMIANTVTRKKAAIISINGKDELAQIGKTINDVRINEIRKERILISYRGEKYWIKKL